ncbi:MsnO8 family LLM class oxidoreductase [Kocuria soli]|uniref:MsnO8 family LLM class oxidoreductase n=1 Tax=Kocuria soli TaxID=2485125 RepID=A0A3N3ZPM4_9MICC|nr:MsnO8 family LLM class oxidoreductase [Kocuria soli]ROZ62065.1 MsnO8 family LLM class oxidoreductase [Kocuria soli]
MNVRISMLDRSRTRRYQTDAAALTQTVTRAQHAESAGYHRFWVSEHHGVPGVASGRPALMAQAVAATTNTIRVGSGGVMLPNHRPLVVAEEFAVLTALHGERFDLGVGRSLGFTKPVREALGTTQAEPADFLRDITRLRDYLTGRAAITMRPSLPGTIPVFVLGTGSGLKFAAELGLPVVVGGPLIAADPAPFEEYRATFRPSAECPEPYLVVSAEIFVADTGSEARELALPEAWAMAQSRLTGAFPPLAPTTTIPAPLAAREAEYVDQALKFVIAGTEDTVQDRLQELITRTGADEIMSTASTFDTQALYASDSRLVEVVKSL